ncbi:ArsR/SmtB family transcription factor [Micromonospora sp. NPDC003197]
MKFLLVQGREVSAGDIALHFPAISRPAVSQHLGVLTEAGLVDARRDGNRRLYRLRPDGYAEAAAFLECMWSDRLGRLKQAAEREERAQASTQDGKDAS